MQKNLQQAGNIKPSLVGFNVFPKGKLVSAEKNIAYNILIFYSQEKYANICFSFRKGIKFAFIKAGFDDLT